MARGVCFAVHWTKRILVYFTGAIIYGVASGIYFYYQGERLPIWVLILALIAAHFLAERAASNKEHQPQTGSVKTGASDTGARNGGSVLQPDYNIEVLIDPLLASEMGISRLRLQGPPTQFFSQSLLPPLNGAEDDNQTMTRIWWYIAYLHHPEPPALLETMRVARQDEHERNEILAGIATFRLPELLIHDDQAVRKMAATLYWECDETYRRTVLTALSGTGAVATPGFNPGVAREIIFSVLKPSCPQESMKAFAHDVKEVLGVDISERNEDQAESR